MFAFTTSLFETFLVANNLQRYPDKNYKEWNNPMQVKLIIISIHFIIIIMLCFLF